MSLSLQLSAPRLGAAGIAEATETARAKSICRWDASIILSPCSLTLVDPAVLWTAGAKLVAKNLDMIVADDVTAPDAGFGVETNRVAILSREGERSCR